MLMKYTSPQNKPHTSNQTQTLFCLGFLPWSLAHLAHIIYRHTHRSEFRIDFYPFPAQPPHGWCSSVMGETVQSPPCKAARSGCATAVRANGTSTALSAPPPLQLYTSPSQNLTSAGPPPFRLLVSLPRHSGMHCWATLARQWPVHSSFESKQLQSITPSTLCSSLLSQETTGAVAFVSCLLLQNILKTPVRLLETLMDY